jgi:hypothetical protein
MQEIQTEVLRNLFNETDNSPVFGKIRTSKYRKHIETQIECTRKEILHIILYLRC